MTKHKTTAADKLNHMAATFRARGAVYGSNYIKLGHAMHALFPDGLTISTPEEWTRLHLFLLGMTKKTRYAHNFLNGGHADSIHDSAVYAALLEAYDENIGAGDQQVGAGHGAQARNAPARAQANGGRRQR